MLPNKIWILRDFFAHIRTQKNAARVRPVKIIRHFSRQNHVGDNDFPRRRAFFFVASHNKGKQKTDCKCYFKVTDSEIQLYFRTAICSIPRNATYFWDADGGTAYLTENLWENLSARVFCGFRFCNIQCFSLKGAGA